MIEEYIYPEGETRASLNIDFPHMELPLIARGGIIISDYTVNKSKKYIIDMVSIRHGLEIMSLKYPHHFEDVINDDADAMTGDVFLQCCAFGEIVYG